MDFLIIYYSNRFLQYNKLEGEIPDVFGDLLNLKELYLAFNELSGPIPASIGKLRSLENLFVHFHLKHPDTATFN